MIPRKTGGIMGLHGTSSLLILMFLITPYLVLATEPPRLIIDAPASLEPIANRLKSLDTRMFVNTMDFLGLTQPGPPIRVIVAPEGSPAAHHAPRWASGYALSHLSTVVLLPERVFHYPYESLEGVLVHEVGHVLIHRTAGEHPLPRWFDEGLAMITARSWDFEDQTRLVWALVSQTQVSLHDLNAMFYQDSASARRAYLLAHAITLDILEHTTPDFPRRLLTDVRQGTPFEEAFARTAMITLKEAEADFWKRQTVWKRWIPVATGSGMLWLGMTLLLFFIYTRQRRQAALIKKRWEEDGDA